MIANLAARGGLSPNGMEPVKAFVQMDESLPDVNLG